jgi:FtsP/CotA-like multicopper oxidase with cupredoxin domain
MMTSASANLHFHGLVIPPVCHQDDTLNTFVQPSDPAYEYRFTVPADQPPGLYWYHPHIHGFTKAQILGGASGALIVDGIETAEPAVAGLPERVFVIRDQELVNPNAEPVQTDSMPAPMVLRDAEGDILNTGTGTGKPAKDLSINFVPVPYPQYQPAIINMKPEERQFWRVLNASAITYLDLQVMFKDQPQWVQVIALDGVPLNHEGQQEPLSKSHILLPPAGRAEFIVKAPPQNMPASLVTRTVNTGPSGENDPTRPLAEIVASTDAPEPREKIAAASTKTVHTHTVTPLQDVEPKHQRVLYFSETPQDPKNPNSPTDFFITVEGKTPKLFDPSSTVPNMTVQSGDVEDWIIENRTQEVHAFHIHQTHFQLLEWNGVPVDEPYLRDTINVPYWDGTSSVYPTVKLRMDFRDPNIVGTFVYHCHLLEHEDGGMMGTIRVLPPPSKSARSTAKPNLSVNPGQ